MNDHKESADTFTVDLTSQAADIFLRNAAGMITRRGGIPGYDHAVVVDFLNKHYSWVVAYEKLGALMAKGH